ncbi:MAG: type IX secretion system protein PorQ [Bacteroidales bacterium]|nr:type IX secretion system protein PorQ [Bacteroidales bacterium]HQP03165.1 type IX secretion system protein PorQ [Bacteroidales bacterium]
MKTIKHIVPVLLLFISITIARGQTGGNNIYEFLNIPPAAHLAALGGNNVSVFDNDLGFVYANPALMHESFSNNLSLNYHNYIADINFAYASYAFHFDKVGTFGAGIYYLNYGDFTHADETGQILGNFSASDYSFNVYYNRPLYERLYAGASLKILYSSMFTYYSSGFAVDLGLHYYSKDSLFSAGVALKNFGTQLKPYFPGNYEPLPYDLQLGVTQRLRHAPFRFSITMQDLLNWSLRYDSPLDDGNVLAADETANDTVNFTIKLNNFFQTVGNAGDEFLRHIIVGVEIVPSQNFYIALGFNYRRRAEMKLDTKSGLLGFSVGAGVKISKFNLGYSFANYHFSGKSHMISLSTNLNSFYKKNGS